MSPPAVVDLRSQSLSMNFPATDSTGDSCSFNAGSSSSRPGLARPRARFFKQRRSSKPSSSTSTSSGDIGVNPFRSVLNSQNCCSSSSSSNIFGQSDRNASSVFGGSNSNEVNANYAAQNVFRDSNYSDHVEKFKSNVAFIFSAGPKVEGANENVKCGEIGSETELANEIKKLYIKHREKGGSIENVEGFDNKGVSKNGESGFECKSGGKDSDVFSESSMPSKGEGSAKKDDKDSGNAGKIDENVFVFRSGNSREPILPEVNGEERDVSSLSSLGTRVDKEKPEVGSASVEKSEFIPTSLSSSAEFNVPGFDSPLLFSVVLSNGFDTKDSRQRLRVYKDKKSKKTEAKLKQSKPAKEPPLQKPVSCQGVAQEEDTPRCYSPMDFSPYEDSTSNHEVPLGVHQPTGQAKVEHENSSVPYTKSQVFMNSGLGAAWTGSSADVSSNTSGHDGNGVQFCFSSNSASTGAEKFAFTASSSTQNHVSSVKCQHKKKYRPKNAKASATRVASASDTPLSCGLQSHGANFFVFESKEKPQTGENQEQGYESELSAAEKACDKWRRRGNEAYEKGELSKAEEFYTWGVNSIPPGDESGAAFRPLVRCYSNRAAARMALGRVREAILDCLTAVKMDPTFHRAQMRAANCYLLLGELKEAMQCFGKLLDSANVICLDRQVVISASEGIQKSQKVIECMNRCAELLKLRTSDAAASALELIAEAMSICSYSEKLLEMKAEALCVLGKHEEAITLCQHSLDFAEKNFTDTSSGKHEVNSSCLDVKLWRCRLSSKCYFHLGRLEAALDLLEKPEFADKNLELPYQLAVTIHELLKQKNAGNTAFQSGKHAEAIEHYTSAILSSMESRPFAAICFCNRAAAHQALGQIADAIADCSLAIALNEDYAKAVSRRATLHEMIRDYKQAAADIQRLVSLLEKQSREKSKQSGSGNGKELRQIQQRLSTMEEEAKKDVPLDLYLILGTKKTDPAPEIKKAYRKAALRHHPDKACQSLVRSDVGDEGHRWKDIADLVHKDSDRLFKMIGEAYAVLSDTTKREEYDHDEDMRKALKESNDLRRTSHRHSDYFNQGYPFERSNNRRYSQDHYKTYSHRR